jgi:hypothetical protein
VSATQLATEVVRVVVSGRLAGAVLEDRVTSPEAIAASLSAPERVLLFCLASGTEWVRVGITTATVQHIVVRGLVDRGATGRLTLTEQGREVLAALLK